MKVTRHPWARRRTLSPRFLRLADLQSYIFRRYDEAHWLVDDRGPARPLDRSWIGKGGGGETTYRWRCIVLYWNNLHKALFPRLNGVYLAVHCG